MPAAACGSASASHGPRRHGRPGLPAGHRCLSRRRRGASGRRRRCREDRGRSLHRGPAPVSARWRPADLRRRRQHGSCACILVVGPPRERPRHLGRRRSKQRRPPGRLPFIFAVRPALMDADGGRVDHLDAAVVGLRHRLEEAVPDADRPPSHEAVVAGCGRSVAFGDVGPWRAHAQPPVGAVERPPAVRPRHSTRPARQQRLSMIDHSKSVSS